MPLFSNPARHRGINTGLHYSLLGGRITIGKEPSCCLLEGTAALFVVELKQQSVQGRTGRVYLVACSSSWHPLVCCTVPAKACFTEHQAPSTAALPTAGN